MKATKWGLLAATLALGACQPAALTPGTPVVTTATGTTPGTSGNISVSYKPFGPLTAPNVDVPALRLTLKPEPGGATLADLDRDKNAGDDFEPEVPAIFQADTYGEGLTVPNAKVRVRGHSTRNSKQKSFRIELDKGAPAWRDQVNLLLNKHPYELTRVRNKLSFDLFQAIPEFVAPKAHFAKLAIDGRDYGFFTDIERVDKRFLASRGLDAKGLLYKAEQFEFTRQPAVLKAVGSAGYDEKAFERVLEINGAKDHTRLLAMLDDVNNEALPINDVIAKHFDRANYVTWLAVNVVTGNLDTNSQNFFLYAPSTGGAFQFIPWDFDGAWGFYDQPDNLAAADSLLAPWQMGPANWWGVSLHRRFMKEPANMRQLQARIDELSTAFFTPARIQAHLDAYKPLVRANLALSPDAERLPSAGSDKLAEHDVEFSRLVGVVSVWRDRFKSASEKPMPMHLGDVTAESGAHKFVWDASYDLQGDTLSYDFAIARDPAFGQIVLERKDLTVTRLTLSDTLPSGRLYYRVTVKDSAGHTQTAFDNYHDEAADREYRGVQPFDVP